MTQINVKIRKLHPDAVTPAYATELAAGFDLVAVEDDIIAPGETALIPTGLAFEIPPDFEMQIRPRSGVSRKTKLRISNSPGTVDADYRGEVGVIVDNIARPELKVLPACDYRLVPVVTQYRRLVNGETTKVEFDFQAEETYIIRKGDRIAQAVIAPIARADFEVVDELTETERGAGGFGSTGVTAE